jgi:hypothetical protein
MKLSRLFLLIRFGVRQNNCSSAANDSGVLISIKEPLQDRGVSEADAGILLLTKEDNGNGLSVREFRSSL